MENEKIVRTIVDKCRIYYQDSLISGESIIEKYLHFFAKQFDSSKRSVNFAFHTGSPCFNIAAAASIVIGCLAYELSSNDDILKDLEIDQMVLYKGERYRWGGIELFAIPGNPLIDYVTLKQDAKGKNGPSSRKIPYEQNKHLIKPYYGTSTGTDGRGVRKDTSNRNDFISFILGIPETDVPTTIDVSVVVVADKQRLIDMCKNLRIEYGDGKSVMITDIAPVAYYTSSGEEIQVGKNQSKAEPVIKATGKISMARDLVLDKHGNRVIGLLVADTVDLNSSELNDLIRRKSLKFVHIMSGFSSKDVDFAIEQYEDAGMFACTKDILSAYSQERHSSNRLTEDLSCQINNIINHSIDAIYVDGGWSWEDYRSIKEGLFALKQSNWSGEEKDNFILSSMALINLFNTAFFGMRVMETAIAEKKINTTVVSPEARIAELQSIASKTPYMKDVCSEIVDILVNMYAELYDASPKGNELVSLLKSNADKRIALVVPKAYYGEIFTLLFGETAEFSNVDCVTANRFNRDVAYDMVIAIGDVIGKKFDSVECYSAPVVQVLLYASEEKLFLRRKRKYDKATRKLNARIKGLTGEDYIRAVGEDEIEEVQERTIMEFSDLDAFVDSIGTFDIRRLVANGGNAGSSLVSEVKYVGVFTTGEQIMFSKYYSAVVFDQNAGEIKEVSPDKLEPGDILVFTKRNDYTQNIVDMIFEQLSKTHRLDDHIEDASVKAFYWKQVLRHYRLKNALSYRALARELRKLGCTLQEVTIRQWLIEESHIVGPQNESVMELIGILTGDEYISADPHSFFEACRVIRHYRREILKLIEMAINDKLSNKEPAPGSVFEIVYENVDKLAEFLEIESISELDETADVSSHLVNRPIEESEV